MLHTYNVSTVQADAIVDALCLEAPETVLLIARCRIPAGFAVPWRRSSQALLVVTSLRILLKSGGGSRVMPASTNPVP